MGRVGDLRYAWASGLGSRTGLVLVGGHDSRWVRRVNRELYEAYVAETGYEAVDGSLLKGLPKAGVVVGVGKKVSAAVEARYRELVVGHGVTAFLKGEGLSGNELGAERKAMVRDLGYFWVWNSGGSVRHVPQDTLPGMTVDMPTLVSGGDVVPVTLMGGRQFNKLSVGLGGDGKVRTLVDKLVGVFDRLPEVVREGEEPDAFSRLVLSSMGFSVYGGRVSGRLKRRWEYGLVDALRREGLLEGDLGGGDSLFPGGLRTDMARVLVPLSSLLVAGIVRRRRALLVVSAMNKCGGQLPAELSPLVPLDMGDCVEYARLMTSTGGASLSHAMWSLSKVEDPAKAFEPQYAKRFSAVGSPMDGGFAKSYVKAFTWGSLKEHWRFVSARPSLATLGASPLGAVAYAARVGQHLSRGLHPITLQPLAEGGGSPEIVKDMVRKVWGPWYVGGRVIGHTGAVGLDRMADSVKPFVKLMT